MNIESAEGYTIAQMSRILGLTPRALRFYEDKELVKPRRVGNNRHYSRSDRERLELIARGKRIGFSLSEIKDLFDLYSKEDKGKHQLEILLTKLCERKTLLLQQLDDIQQVLHEIDQNTAQIENRISELGDREISRAQAYEKLASLSIGDS